MSGAEMECAFFFFFLTFELYNFLASRNHYKKSSGWKNKSSLNGED